MMSNAWRRIHASTNAVAIAKANRTNFFEFPRVDGTIFTIPTLLAAPREVRDNPAQMKLPVTLVEGSAAEFCKNERQQEAVGGRTSGSKNAAYGKLFNKWSHPPGSNRRPADYESAALPTELGWLSAQNIMGK
jgi:hypothetical protein